MKIKELRKLFGNTWRKRINTSSNRKIVLAVLIVLVLWLFLFYTPAERYLMRRSFKRWIYSEYTLGPNRAGKTLDQLYIESRQNNIPKECGRLRIIFGLRIRTYLKWYNKDNCNYSRYGRL